MRARLALADEHGPALREAYEDVSLRLAAELHPQELFDSAVEHVTLEARLPDLQVQSAGRRPGGGCCVHSLAPQAAPLAPLAPLAPRGTASSNAHHLHTAVPCLPAYAVLQVVPSTSLKELQYLVATTLRYRRRQLLKLVQDDGRTFWVDAKEAVGSNAHCMLLCQVGLWVCLGPGGARKARSAAQRRKGRGCQRPEEGGHNTGGACTTSCLACPFRCVGCST